MKREQRLSGKCGDLVELIKCLNDNEESGIRSWLLKRLLMPTKRLPDRLVAAICRGDLSNLSELLSATGLDRLKIMTGLCVGEEKDDTQYLQSLCSLALVQLELLPPTAASAERLALSLLAGQLNGFADSIPWEGLLLAAMTYPPRSLAQAANIMDKVDDPAWMIIAFHANRRSECIQRALYPHGLDYSAPFLIIQAMNINQDVRLKSLLHAIKVGLAGQLLASGEWHLAAKLIPLDIGPFVRLEDEQRDQMTLAQRLYYRQQESCIEKGILISAKADRNGYSGLVADQVRLLVVAGRYQEAQRAARPLIVDAIISGQDEADINSLALAIPVTERTGLTKVFSLYNPWRMGSPLEGDDLELLIEIVSQIRPETIRERVALAEIATRLSMIRPTESLIPLLPPDQCLTLIHRLVVHSV
jgi:hypothetical protein